MALLVLYPAQQGRGRRPGLAQPSFHHPLTPPPDHQNQGECLGNLHPFASILSLSLFLSVPRSGQLLEHAQGSSHAHCLLALVYQSQGRFYMAPVTLCPGIQLLLAIMWRPEMAGDAWIQRLMVTEQGGGNHSESLNYDHTDSWVLTSPAMEIRGELFDCMCEKRPSFDTVGGKMPVAE